MPQVSNIRTQNGVGGQYSISADVTYTDGTYRLTFVSSVYGGPIVMVAPSGLQTFVSREVTDRIGSKLDAEWLREFFKDN